MEPSNFKYSHLMKGFANWYEKNKIEIQAAFNADKDTILDLFESYEDFVAELYISLFLKEFDTEDLDDFASMGIESPEELVNAWHFINSWYNTLPYENQNLHWKENRSYSRKMDFCSQKQKVVIIIRTFNTSI